MLASYISESKCLRSRRRYLAFTVAMMPVSHGWRRDVVLGGKNTCLRLESVTAGWAEQLSTKRSIFLLLARILEFSLLHHSLKSLDVIQARLLALYVTVSRDLSMHRSVLWFWDFPITNRLSFSPVQMQPRGQ